MINRRGEGRCEAEALQNRRRRVINGELGVLARRAQLLAVPELLVAAPPLGNAGALLSLGHGLSEIYLPEQDDAYVG